MAEIELTRHVDCSNHRLRVSLVQDIIRSRIEARDVEFKANDRVNKKERGEEGKRC